MKKQLLALTLMLATTVLYVRGQALPILNSSFEDWVSVDGVDYPVSWGVSDSSEVRAYISKSSEAVVGNYAIRFDSYSGVTAPFVEINDTIPDGVVINQVEYLINTKNISNPFTDGAVLRITKYNANFDYMSDREIKITSNTEDWGIVKERINMNGVKYIIITLQLIDFSKSGAYAIFDDIKFTKNTASLEPIEIISTTVYPNPAQNTIIVDSELPLSYAKITNQLGQIIKEYNEVSSNIFDVSELPQGVYVVQATRNDGKLVSSKFIKQ
jgi:hypothetical protein